MTRGTNRQEEERPGKSQRRQKISNHELQKRNELEMGQAASLTRGKSENNQKISKDVAFLVASCSF
jgi:hypothetical protein